MTNRRNQAPKHLKPATRKWWEHVCENYDLEQHRIKLLTLAGEAWDRGTQAREALKQHGLTFTTRYGEVRPRPEVQIERDSRIGFARLLRELNLDVEQPDDSRPPYLRY